MTERRHPIIAAGKIAVAVLYGVPILWIVLTSFKRSEDVFTSQNAVFFEPTLETYRNVLTSDLVKSAVKSLFIASGTTLLVLIVAVPASFMLARANKYLSIFGLTLLMILQMTPQTASVIPLFQIFNRIHILDSLLSVILADAALLTPFAILTLRPFFRSVPFSLEEAGQIDGASMWVVFRRICLPLARNGIATTGTLVFIISWGEFLYAVNLLVSPSEYPLSAVLAQQVGGFGIFWPGLMALSVLASLPIAVIFLLTYRQLKDGLTVGAVK